MKYTASSFAIAAFSLVGAQAATIVWDNAAPTSSQNIVTDSSVLISNVLSAWNFTHQDTADKTTNGVTFKGIDSRDGTPLSATSGSFTLAQAATGDARDADYWNGPATDAGFEDIMQGWGGKLWNQGSATLTLSGLTAETDYRVQFFYSASNANNTKQTTVDIDGSATDGRILANPDDGGLNDGLGQYIVGTLTTGIGETSSTITISGAGELSAMAIGTITPVPEPSSLALLGLGGLAFARRRRS